MNREPLYLEASIKVNEATEALRERASSIIDLPVEGEKQIDLMYFTAIFVSSGENLNNAFFEPTELLKAEKTIVNKALDIEHKEKEIIGHLYDRVFIDASGSVLDMNELKSMDAATFNSKDIHVAIAGIIYKNRFPEVAAEVSEGKWKVSMEAYYSDFDLKIGSLILTRKEAEALGFTSINSIIGKVGKVIKNGKEIANGTIARILRNITFSGCGIVENPANPPSVILEVAEHKYNKKGPSDKEVIIFELDRNKLTSSFIDAINLEQASDPVIVHNDTIGICVNYKRRVNAKDDTIIHEDWCSKFESQCTASAREATDPDCLLNKIYESVSFVVNKRVNSKKIDKLLKNLSSALEKISK